jgi:multidrug efflux pump subunit AcrA (membrane-fusion protein)
MAPRLRKDLVATTADEQGVACVEVTDTASGASFRFYDFEYALAQQLTGQPLEDVAAWAQATYGIALSSDTLDQFLQKLEGLGFLADDGSGSPPRDKKDVLPVAEAMNAPVANLASTSGGEGSPRPGEPLSLLPGIEVLAGPLPPVAAPVVAAAPWPVATDHPRRTGTIAGVGPLSVRDGAAVVETPLGSIARAIAESNAPPPPGALDVGLTAGVFRSGEGDGSLAEISRSATAAPSVHSASGAPFRLASGVTSPATSGLTSRASWGSDLVDEVDQSRGDRRETSPAEVVVLPPLAEPSVAEAPRRRGRSAAFGLLLIAGAIASAVWFLRPGEGSPTPASPSAQPSPSPAASEVAARVHVVSPQPTTFYRWFDRSGVVVPGGDDTLAFHSGGRVQDVMPPGTTFSAGEAIARLQGVATRELVVNRLRSRVAYLEQLRDSTRAQGTEEATRQAEAKLTLRKQDLANAQAALAELEIRPKVAGEIAELLVQKGSMVKTGASVFRVRATGVRVTFAFGAEDAARARALRFCRIETVPGTGAGVDGGPNEARPRAIDCTFSPVAGDAGAEPRLAVDLVGASGIAPGTEVRLASARFDGVFPVPRSALVRQGDADHVWIVPAGGHRAESRAVQIGATVDELGLVAHGITVGDAIVIDPPATLKNGTEVEVVR